MLHPYHITVKHSKVKMVFASGLSSMKKDNKCYKQGYESKHQAISTWQEVTKYSRLPRQIYTVSQKSETRVILNILYSCKSTAMKVSMLYPDDLSN